MEQTNITEVNEVERLRNQLLLARNQIEELHGCLNESEQRLRQLKKRMALRPEERAILGGHGDGCIRVAEVWPILDRLLGEAVHRNAEGALA